MMREKLAELAHEQWSGWMKYLFSKGTFNLDGTWTMPKWAVERWVRQMAISYTNLSDKEQESDRKEADRFLHAFREEDYLDPEVRKARYDMLAQIQADPCPKCGGTDFTCVDCFGVRNEHMGKA